MLTNPVYLGLIRHKDQTFAGQHTAIVDQDLWDKVQEHPKSASARRRGAPAGQGADAEAPLKGKVRDETGDILTPTHTLRRGKRQRYYVSNRLISGGVDPTGWRLPARPFETAVVKGIADHLNAQANRHAILNDGDITKTEAATKAVFKLASELETEGCKQVTPLIRAISINKNQLNIALDPQAVAGATNLPASWLHGSLCKIATSIACKRRGVEMRIVAGERRPEPDQTLVRALRNAHDWAGKLKAGQPLKEIAGHVGFTDGYLRRVISLVSLSPKLQSAILDGTQPTDLNLETLVRGTIPLDWTHQDRLFGLTA